MMTVKELKAKKVVELNIEFSTPSEADDKGANFYEQFPDSSFLVLNDTFGYEHDVYVYKFYIENNQCYIDGWDSTIGKTVKKWPVNKSNLFEVAQYIEAIIKLK